MQLAAALLQDALVGRLLNEGVLEDVLELGVAGALEHQLARLKAVEALVEFALRLRDRGQETVEEAAPDHRCQAQDLLEVLVEAVDARHDHPDQRVGQADGCRPLGDAIAARRAVAHEAAEIDEAAHDLLDEEGVALGLGEDEVAQPGREVIEADQVVDERLALCGRERLQRDLRRAFGVAVRASCCDRVSAVSGSGRATQHTRSGSSSMRGSRCSSRAAEEASSQCTSSNATTSGFSCARRVK